MSSNIVKVRAVPGRLVTDIDALEAGLRRFVGCKFNPQKRCWEPSEKAAFVDASRVEYKRAIKAGDLIVEKL